MLSDLRCRTAKPKPKAYKLPDDRGLYLFVTPSGFKSWRMKYRFAQKEKSLTFGGYPEISLIAARDQRDAARALLRDSIDPGVARKQRRAERYVEALNTFEIVTRRWHAQQKPHWTPRYARQVLERFENDVFPDLGSLPITDLTVALVLGALRKVQARGALEGAHRLRQHMSDVFATAIAEGTAAANPAGGVAKALQRVVTSRRPAVLDVAAARRVVATIDAASAYAVTKLASRFLALTAARPGVVRLAERAEMERLDGPDPIWRIPAEKMKLTAAQKRDVAYEFIVPLSPHAVEVIRLAAEISGNRTLLFPSVSNAKVPLSDSTLSKLYRDAGFTGIHVPHGWRSTFSTVMNALAGEENRVGDREVIDLMLAHMAAGVEPIYNRYAYMPRRRALAEEWAVLLMADAPPPASLLESQRGSSPRNRRRGREWRL